jgi:hypothetical protein
LSLCLGGCSTESRSFHVTVDNPVTVTQTVTQPVTVTTIKTVVVTQTSIIVPTSTTTKPTTTEVKKIMSNKETIYYATLLDFQSHIACNYREGEILHLILTVSDILGSNLVFYFDTKEDGGIFASARLPLFKDVKIGDTISFSGIVNGNSNKNIVLAQCKPE